MRVEFLSPEAEINPDDDNVDVLVFNSTTGARIAQSSLHQTIFTGACKTKA